MQAEIRKRVERRTWNNARRVYIKDVREKVKRKVHRGEWEIRIKRIGLIKTSNPAKLDLRIAAYYYYVAALPQRIKKHKK